MSKATKTKVMLFGVILAVTLSSVVALCLAFIPMNDGRNEQELSNADYTYYTYGSWEYIVDGGFAYVTRYKDSTNANTNLTIPSTLGSYTVKGLKNTHNYGSGIFGNYQYLKDLSIPETVSVIGLNCFDQSYYELSSVRFLGTLSQWCEISIGTGWSYHDNNPIYCAENFYVNGELINNLVIPTTVTQIKEGSFCGFKGASITLHDGITSIGDYAFYNCRNITTLTIPRSVTSIGERAFESCTRVDTFNFNATNCAVQTDSFKPAFGYLGNLGNSGKGAIINIGSNVESIPAWFFYPYKVNGASGYVKIKEVNWLGTSSCVSIGEYAFYQCSSLPAISIPSSVTSIGQNAFNSCYNIIDVILPANLTSIGDNAFFGCTRLLEVINKSPLNIVPGSTANGYVAYYAKGVETDESHSKFQVINDVKYYVDMTKNICVAVTFENSPTNIVLNSNCTEVSSYAFKDCSSLTSLTIPETVTKIGNYAFYGCNALTALNYNAINCTVQKTTTSNCNYIFCNAGSSSGSVILNIGENVEVIPASLFYPFVGSSSYGTVYPRISQVNWLGTSHCKTIGSYAFANCLSLTSITIPESITTIESGAFLVCTNLVTINYNAVNCNDFYANNHTFLRVGRTSTGITLNIGPNVKRIPNEFLGKDNYIESYSAYVKTVNWIGDSTCTEIGFNAFCDCANLTNMTLPNSICKLGRWSLPTNANVVYTTYQNALYLGNTSNPYVVCVKAASTSVTDVTIHDDTRIIYYGAFQGCSNLSNATIPDSIVQICPYAFDDCSSSLYKTYNNAIYVGTVNNQYAYCVVYTSSSITSVTIPESTRFVNNEAFYDCSSLTTINFNAKNCYDFDFYYNRVFSGTSSTSLTVNIGKNVTRIPAYMFYYFGYLGSSVAVSGENSGDVTKLSFANGSCCTSIGAYAFCYSSIKTLVIPDCVTDIGTGAFSESYSLTSLTVGSGITYIDESMFNVYYLKTLTLKSGVSCIGDNTFDSCYDLSNVYFYHDYSTGIQTTDKTAPNYLGLNAFTNGKSNVVYHFVNPASRNSARNLSNRAKYFTSSNFEVIPSFNTNVNDESYGSITLNTTPQLNNQVTMTAVPNEGYALDCWLKNGVSFAGNTANPLTVNYTEYVEYTAVFDTGYRITAIPQVENIGIVTGGGDYVYGRSIMLEAAQIPGSNYVFSKWLHNGEDFEGNLSSQIEIVVTKADTYVAAFVLGYKVTINNYAHEEGVVDGEGVYYENTEVTITATPNTGAKFFYWLKNGQTFAGSLQNPLTITVTEDVTYTVLFAPEDFVMELYSPNSVILEYEYQGTETVNPEVCGMLKTYCYGDFDNMTTICVEAIPTTGYRFVGWKINGVDEISAKYTTNIADILLTDIPNSKIVIAVFDKVTE